MAIWLTNQEQADLAYYQHLMYQAKRNGDAPTLINIAQQASAYLANVNANIQQRQQQQAAATLLGNIVKGIINFASGVVGNLINLFSSNDEATARAQTNHATLTDDDALKYSDINFGAAGGGDPKLGHGPMAIGDGHAGSGPTLDQGDTYYSWKILADTLRALYALNNGSHLLPNLNAMSYDELYQFATSPQTPTNDYFSSLWDTMKWGIGDLNLKSDIYTQFLLALPPHEKLIYLLTLQGYLNRAESFSAEYMETELPHGLAELPTELFDYNLDNIIYLAESNQPFAYPYSDTLLNLIQLTLAGIQDSIVQAQNDGYVASHIIAEYVAGNFGDEVGEQAYDTLDIALTFGIFGTDLRYFSPHHSSGGSSGGFDAEQAARNIVGNTSSSPINKGKQYFIQGSAQDARNHFYSLNPTNVRQKPNMLIGEKNGTTIIWRTFSSGNNYPTLEFHTLTPNGLEYIKIRYMP